MWNWWICPSTLYCEGEKLAKRTSSLSSLCSAANKWGLVSIKWKLKFQLVGSNLTTCTNSWLQRKLAKFGFRTPARHWTGPPEFFAFSYYTARDCETGLLQNDDNSTNDAIDIKNIYIVSMSHLKTHVRVGMYNNVNWLLPTQRNWKLFWRPGDGFMLVSRDFLRAPFWLTRRLRWKCRLPALSII